ncbi:hypothetical protein L1887_43648 [Cichorium endivia]|nr:hypothetical protein L1887_43648 [Cichorium endivia]
MNKAGKQGWRDRQRDICSSGLRKHGLCTPKLLGVLFSPLKLDWRGFDEGQQAMHKQPCRRTSDPTPVTPLCIMRSQCSAADRHAARRICAKPLGPSSPWKRLWKGPGQAPN